MTQVTFEQMVERIARAHLISKGIPDAAAWAAEGEMLIEFAGLIRDELVKGQEPVAWQFFYQDRWLNGDDSIKDHRKNTEEAGYPVRDIYARPVVAAPAGVPDGNELQTAITVFDMGLAFALCHSNFTDTRNAIKKLQADFNGIRDMLSAAPAAPADAVAKDAAMLNFLSRPGIEIGTESEEGEFWHVVYEVVGSVNDREWRELGRGATLRAAIAAAMQGKESVNA